LNFIKKQVYIWQREMKLKSFENFCLHPVLWLHPVPNFIEIRAVAKEMKHPVDIHKRFLLYAFLSAFYVKNAYNLKN
jgi:hypothetical protein